MSAPTVIAPESARPAPRQSTKAVQAATITVTTGESSDFTRRARSAASTVAWLATSRRDSSRSSRPKALTDFSDSRPCCTTATISLWCVRTSCVAFLTACLKRATKNRRKGVTPTATSAKSQSRYSISASMPTMLQASTRIESSADEAKSWIVATSVVIVLSIAPVWCVS